VDADIATRGAERQCARVTQTEQAAEARNCGADSPEASVSVSERSPCSPEKANTLFAENVGDPAQTPELQSENVRLPLSLSVDRGSTTVRVNGVTVGAALAEVDTAVPTAEAHEERVVSTLNVDQSSDALADAGRREGSLSSCESDYPRLTLYVGDEAKSGTSNDHELNSSIVREPGERAADDDNVPQVLLSLDEAPRGSGMSISTTELTSTETQILPTAGSILLLAAAETTERMTTSASQRTASSGEPSSDVPTEPDSPRRSQISSSPPSSPSRIANLVAAKLFGWHQTKEAVEEVDL
jgi:hypothetical protein